MCNKEIEMFWPSVDTRWFKYDRDLCGLFTHKSVPVIFEPPCTIPCSKEVLVQDGITSFSRFVTD